ncbi:MAG TPA: hypothetical protein VGM64_06680 [Lacunisphaera sp.]|jgi:hypothetical protein
MIPNTKLGVRPYKRLGKVGLVILGLASAAYGYGSQTAFNVSAPISGFDGSDLSLLGTAQLGSQMYFSLTYGPLVVSNPGPEDRVYTSPIESTFVKAFIGGRTYDMNEYFTEGIEQHQTEVSGPLTNEIWSGDFVTFSVQSAQRTETNPNGASIISNLFFQTVH